MQHLAIIPDGNRRWAKKNKLKTLQGHKRGMDSFEVAIKTCIKNKIKYLSIYLFSLENFRRSEEEKNYLFKFLVKEKINKTNEMLEKGIKVKFIGNKSLFSDDIKEAINYMENKTKNLNNLNLNLLFGYGSRDEIVHATKKIAQQAIDRKIEIDSINEKSFESFLWTNGMPNPELIIRTGKRNRLSNFLLYQAAYSELMFLDYFWPEITEEKLINCIENFKKIERNFGK